MAYVLTLFFSCGHGCGYPDQVRIPATYADYQQCDAAGQKWLAPGANPMKALSGYQCSANRNGTRPGKR
jgi:hypothetical protein